MTAIEVEHLHKTFRIPHEKRTTHIRDFDWNFQTSDL